MHFLRNCICFKASFPCVSSSPPHRFPFVSVSPVLLLSHSALCTRTGGGQADKSQSDTFPRAAIICPVMVWNLTSTGICVWITPSLCKYVAALQPGEIHPPHLNCSHKRQIGLVHHTGGAIPVDFILSGPGYLHPFFSAALIFIIFFFSLPLGLVSFISRKGWKYPHVHTTRVAETCTGTHTSQDGIA